LKLRLQSPNHGPTHSHGFALAESLRDAFGDALAESLGDALAESLSTLVSSGSSPFLSLSPVQISDAARYFVVCADLLGNTIESAAAQLTVLPKGD